MHEGVTGYGFDDAWAFDPLQEPTSSPILGQPFRYGTSGRCRHERHAPLRDAKKYVAKIGGEGHPVYQTAVAVFQQDVRWESDSLQSAPQLSQLRIDTLSKDAVDRTAVL